MRLIPRNIMAAFFGAALGLLLINPSLAQRTFDGTSSSRISTTPQANADGSRAMGTAVIQYDSETGSIIVISDEETNERIKEVVANLDRPVPQVLIKVLFLEVTHSKDSDLGTELALSHISGTDSARASTFFGINDESRGGFLRVVEGDLEATLHALANNNKLEVLSRPSVLARNNQEAIITVGQKVPFITSSFITEEGQTRNTIQYRDIGIILHVLPRIMPNRTVEMLVSPEISNLTAQTIEVSDTVDAPVIALRSAETSVVVDDGKTVVIGGMMENNDTERVSKVPLLGDIPYLGGLFRRTIKVKAKTELLIFLTPQVVEGPDELHEMTESEKENNVLAPNVFSEKDMNRFLNTCPPNDENQ